MSDIIPALIAIAANVFFYYCALYYRYDGEHNNSKPDVKS